MDAHFAKTLAGKLDTAWRNRAPIAPLTQSDGVADAQTAYAIQTEWTRLRTARGDKIAGRKIGLTAKAVQQQLGVDQPDYGTLWQSNFYETRNGKLEVPAADFISPRIEGEVAFLIGKTLEGSNLTAEDVLAATEACALGIELVDSRIADWKITFFDTVADNASFGGFSVGPWDKAMKGQDLAALSMRIHQNGTLAGEALGAAVLGNPAMACAWLANKLNGFGVRLEPGDIVISGAFTKMLPFKQGDEFLFALAGQPDIAVNII